MSEKKDLKRISFDEYVSEEDCTVEEVETKRGLLVIGSCSSAEILEWFAENDAVLEDGRPDMEKRKHRGLRLVSRCILNADGSRLPKEVRASAMEQLKKHDSRENGRLMAAAFRVCGLEVVTTPAKDTAERKNDSSGTSAGVSPIV